MVKIKRLELRGKVERFLGGIALSEFYGPMDRPMGMPMGI